MTENTIETKEVNNPPKLMFNEGTKFEHSERNSLILFDQINNVTTSQFVIGRPGVGQSFYLTFITKT